MENSKFSFRKWLQIMLFMTSTKKGMSACEIQRQMRHSRYNTVLSIMNRIRDVMGKRDDRYQLNDMVEFDEGFFETEVSERFVPILKEVKGANDKLMLLSWLNLFLLKTWKQILKVNHVVTLK